MGAGKRTASLVAAVIFAMLFLAVIRILTSDPDRFPFGFLRVTSARHMRISADLQAIRFELGVYKAMNGVYPSTEQGLAAFVAEPTASPTPSRWAKLLSGLPKDPWGNDYVYRCPGKIHFDTYDLFSPGPDHIADTADDDWGE